jgi:hypothetical protein
MPQLLFPATRPPYRNAVTSFEFMSGQRTPRADMHWLTVGISMIGLAARPQRTTLARKQGASKQVSENDRATLTLHIEKTAARKWKFVLTNISEVDAQNVELKLLATGQKLGPLISKKYRKKIPLGKLSRKSSVTFVPLCNGQDAVAYKALLTWENNDGSKGSQEASARNAQPASSARSSHPTRRPVLEQSTPQAGEH